MANASSSFNVSGDSGQLLSVLSSVTFSINISSSLSTIELAAVVITQKSALALTSKLLSSVTKDTEGTTSVMEILSGTIGSNGTSLDKNVASQAVSLLFTLTSTFSSLTIQSTTQTTTILTKGFRILETLISSFKSSASGLTKRTTNGQTVQSVVKNLLYVGASSATCGADFASSDSSNTNIIVKGSSSTVQDPSTGDISAINASITGFSVLSTVGNTSVIGSCPLYSLEMKNTVGTGFVSSGSLSSRSILAIDSSVYSFSYINSTDGSRYSNVNNTAYFNITVPTTLVSTYSLNTTSSAYNANCAYYVYSDPSNPDPSSGTLSNSGVTTLQTVINTDGTITVMCSTTQTGDFVIAVANIPTTTTSSIAGSTTPIATTSSAAIASSTTSTASASPTASPSAAHPVINMKGSFFLGLVGLVFTLPWIL